MITSQLIRERKYYFLGLLSDDNHNCCLPKAYSLQKVNKEETLTGSPAVQEQDGMSECLVPKISHSWPYISMATLFLFLITTEFHIVQ